MSLDTLVSVTISTTSESISRAGFGTPLIADAAAPFVGARVRSYGGLAEMVTDGYAVTDAAYLAAQKLISQNPKVPLWKVGRLDLPWSQAVDITVGAGGDAEGLVHNILVTSPAGVQTTVSRTVPGASSIAAEVTAITALLDAIVDLSAAAASPDINVTADNPAELWSFTALNKELTIKTVTTDPGIGTDLAAILAEDSDWYGLLLDHKSEAITNATAAVIETERKIFVAQHSDSEIKDAAVTTDVFSDLQAAAYARSIGLFHEDDRGFADAAWMGAQFPKTPGSSQWGYQTLAGVTVSSLTAGAQKAITDKNGNHYTSITGGNTTLFGASASGEFIDTTRFIDELTVRLQEDVFAVLLANEKIPFTDAGIAVIKGTVSARLDQGVLQGGLAADPAPVVTAPKAADVPTPDKAARNLPDVNFTATLAGAILTAEINGVVSV